MNLGQLRATLLAFRSWESSGTAMDTKIQAIIWMAMQRMASDCASALVPEVEHAVLYRDHTAFGSAGTAGFEEMLLWPTLDEYVFEWLNAAGAAMPNPLPADADVPVTDRSWDWRIHLEFTDQDGVTHRRVCREFWVVETFGVDNHYYVSLDRQYLNAGHAGVPFTSFRLHQPYYYTSPLVRRVLNHGLWTDSRDKLSPLSQASAEQAGEVDYRGQSSGRPSVVREGPRVQVPAPNRAPVVTQDTQLIFTWNGPEPPGQFAFRLTYCYGHRDVEWQEAPGVQFQDPLWESAPSPEAEITMVCDDQDPYLRIVVELPNLAWMQWFDDVGGLGWLRGQHTGAWIRIYACRKSVIPAGLANEVDNIEADPNIFYLVGEEWAGTQYFFWDGTWPPDYFRRIPLSSGYYGWSVWPHQDQDYQVDLRVLRNPVPLYSDSDWVPFHEDALPAFVELCLYYMAVMDGVDINVAKVHEDNYKGMIGKVAADHGNRAPIVERPSWYSDDGVPCGIPGWNQSRTP